MFVPAGSPIFFLREHRFAVRCRVVTLTLLFMLSTCLLDIFLYIFFINIGCATLYHLSMMYVTVYNMSFNSNCRILAAELNYRFTPFFIGLSYSLCLIVNKLAISSDSKSPTQSLRLLVKGIGYLWLVCSEINQNINK